MSVLIFSFHFKVHTHGSWLALALFDIYCKMSNVRFCLPKKTYLRAINANQFWLPFLENWYIIFFLFSYIVLILVYILFSTWFRRISLLFSCQCFWCYTIENLCNRFYETLIQINRVKIQNTEKAHSINNTNATFFFFGNSIINAHWIVILFTKKLV